MRQARSIVKYYLTKVNIFDIDRPSTRGASTSRMFIDDEDWYIKKDRGNAEDPMVLIEIVTREEQQGYTRRQLRVAGARKGLA